MSSEAKLRDLPHLIKSFIKDPIGFMKTPRSLSWPAIASLQVGTAAVSGALVGLMSRNFLDFLTGLFIYPITSLVIVGVFALFVYYFFSIFRSTFLELRRLVTIIAFALLPYFVFHTISGWLSPIDLLGMAFTGLLLAVGLVEQFGLDRKTVFRLLIGCGTAFFLAWGTVQIRSHLSDREREFEGPKALDDIETEF